MKKVMVAMSGGVDSTVTAYLLKKEGFEVEGVYMKIHTREELHKRYMSNVKKVAEYLGIKVHILDKTEEFMERVYNPFIRGYIEGLTPNPCAICNRYMKFGALVDFAQSQGADFFATGHYVKTDGKFLYEAKDKSKDQSYFLFNIKKEVLPKLLFPLGDMYKEDVKKIARDIEPLREIAEQKESSEICFVENTYIDILREHTKVDMPGVVVDKEGNVIGEHKGYMHYTIGKRKGFTVYGAHEPHYVLKIIPEENKIVVGKREDLDVREVELKDLNMFEEKKEFEATIKVRYRMNKVPCKAVIKNSHAKVYLKEPVFGVASGQAGVFYEGEKVLGGGWIV
ncbi:tRNA 2-thiouridine(34) synthase MnmA [Nitrosophilus alvini]|uniref:tRNA 2-thiouridine(34) synthase MnmA n=1 Tax=Nitrosophilus alvini TaxID=2714855 RepID=UPI00190AE582|nr:tRNA 2-thiouridine(34) synthase MnmA [Nitrosophilus alvini]